MASGRPRVGSRAQKGTGQPLIAQNPAWKGWVGEYGLFPQFSLRICDDFRHPNRTAWSTRNWPLD